jgi:ATP-dependent Lhr-like helicase
MRVNGAWGMALKEKVRRTLGLQAEASHVDDGLLLSFAPGQVPPSPSRLVTLLAPDEVDTLLGEALIGSPLFTTRFRHAAVRALFIARSQGGQRTPAWLQRLKADALMEAVRGQPDFPIVAETLRECFNDALDVPRLKEVLGRLHQGAMWTRHVDTPMPSPFVYPLLLAWDWAYLDAGHAEERRTDAVQMRKSWNMAAGPLRADIAAAVEAELQRVTPERRARDANELAAMLDDLGDLSLEEIGPRALADASALIEALRAEQRVIALDLRGGGQVWIGALDEPLYRALGTEAGLEKTLLRVVRSRGPFTAAALAQRYGVDPALVTRVLDRLELRGLLRKGAFLDGTPAPQYLHIAVLDEIQRRQAHSRRVPRPVASADRFSAFLLRRHHLHPEYRLTGPNGVLAALELLQGEDFPVRVWEQELLPARVEGYQREWLDQLGLAGEIVFTPFERRRSGRVGVTLRENLGWLREPPPTPPELDEQAKAALRHLELRGASFAQDIARTLRIETSRGLAMLWELFWAGLVTPDTFGAIVTGAAARPGGNTARPGAETKPLALGRRRRRGQARGLVPPSRLLGRWSAIADEEPLSPDERDEARAHLLLARYGVVARELAFGEWSSLRHALLRMEYGGEVVRGYFVQGLSGEQYALEDALAELTKDARRAEPHVLVNITDPANLWGRVFPVSRPDGSRVSAARIPQSWLVVRHGRPVVLAEGHGRDLTALAGFEDVDLPGAVRALQSVFERPPTLRPVRRLEVLTWNGRPVRETPAFAALVDAGFTVDGDRLTWDGHVGPK